MFKYDSDWDNVKCLVDYLREHVDYDDSEELAQILGVDEDWLDQFFDDEEDLYD